MTLSLRDNLVTGLAIRFGNAHERDRTNQYFDARTQLYLDQYIPGAPVWLSHTYDIDTGRPLADASPIGEMVSYRVQPGFGVWITTELTLPETDPRYAPLVADLLAGNMRYSSDSIEHIVNPRIGPDGHIAVWPLAGLSIVHKDHAAEPRLPVLAAKACQAAYAAAWKSINLRSDPMPTKHNAFKAADMSAVNDLLGQAAGLLDIEPNADALIAVLQEAKAGESAKMDDAIAGQFQDLLAQVAQLLGIEPTVEALIGALQQMQGAEEGDAQPVPAEKSDQAPQQAAPAAQPQPAPAAQPQQPQQPQPTAQQPTAKTAGLTEDSIRRVVADALASWKPQPEAEEEPVDPVAVATAAAKAATELTLQQLHALPTAGVAPAQSGTPIVGAFAVPPQEGEKRMPASKSFHFNLRAQPSGPPSYKAILDAVTNGPAACKAIGLDFGEAGGYVLPRERSQEIIDLLYANEVAMALGADFQTMATQTMDVPKLIEGAQAFYLADNEEAVESQAKFGQVTLNLKRLTAMSRVSKRWLRYSSGPAAERKIRDDLSKAVTLRQDLDVLRGTGSVPGSDHAGAAPLGVRWSEGIATIDGGSELPTLEILEEMVLQLMRNNVDDDGTYGWVMHPTVLAQFTNMKDANGNPVLRKNWADKPYATLLGYRYATTTQIPITLGTSGKVTSSGELSEIYFGRWSDMVIGVGMDVTVSTTTERYWELDQVGIRVDVDWDAVLFRPEAFVVAKSVKPFPTG